MGKPPGYDRGSMREAAAAFVRDVVRPAVATWDEAGSYPREAVAASGLTGLFCPPEYGGAGLGYPAGMEAFGGLGPGDAALAVSLSLHNAVAAGGAGGRGGGPRERRAGAPRPGARPGGGSP